MSNKTMNAFDFKLYLRKTYLIRKSQEEKLEKLPPSPSLESISTMVAEATIRKDYPVMHYDIISSTEKVRLMDDNRDFEMLCFVFRDIDTSQLQHVWDKQFSWVACCDILKSLQLSHSTQMQIDFNFDLNAHEWPAIRCMPVLGLEVSSHCNSSVSRRSAHIADDSVSYVSSTADSWSLCDTIEELGCDEEEDQLCMSAQSALTSSCGVILSGGQEHDGACDDWEFMEASTDEIDGCDDTSDSVRESSVATLIYEPQFSEFAEDENGGGAPSLSTSYREALLSSLDTDTSVANNDLSIGMGELVPLQTSLFRRRRVPFLQFSCAIDDDPALLEFENHDTYDDFLHRSCIWTTKSSLKTKRRLQRRIKGEKNRAHR